MEEIPEDTLPGMEQLAVKPGRRACHIREDSNIEPVFMHSLSPKFHEELIHSLCIHAMVDGTPGSGAAAVACICKRIPYLGACFTDSHKELFIQHLIHLMIKEMGKEDSVLYEPGMVKSATPPQAKPKRSGEDEGKNRQGRKKMRPGAINLSGNGEDENVIGMGTDDEKSDEGE